MLEACIPSEEVRTHLSKIPVSKYTLGQIIWNAPISLYEKAALLESLTLKEDLICSVAQRLHVRKHGGARTGNYEMALLIARSFTNQYRQIRRAITELETAEDAVFNLVEKWYDDELLDEKSSSGAPFLSIQKAAGYIKYDMQECEIDETSACWYEIEKWVKDDEENLELRFTYTFIGETPVFCYEHKPCGTRHPLEWFCLRSPSSFLDIPLPYSTGDIVTIDCLPFAPPKAALIVEEPRSDSCYPTMLSRNQKGYWDISSLKRGYFSNGNAPATLALSPCYNLRKHEEPLADDEAILYEVREWLHSDPSRGSKLWIAYNQSDLYEMTPDDIHQLLCTAERQPNHD